MTNHRMTCLYCKTSVLCRDIGKHYLSKHSKELFQGDNLKALYREKALSKPLQLCIGEEWYYFCLGDSSCIKREDLAVKHFKGLEDKHKQAVLSYRENFPRLATNEPEAAPVVVQAPALSAKELELIHGTLASLLGMVRDYERKCKNLDEEYPFEVDKRVSKALAKLDIVYDEDELKSMFPYAFIVSEPEDEKEVAPLPENNDDIKSVADEQPVIPIPVVEPAPVETVVKVEVVEKPKSSSTIPRVNVALLAPSKPQSMPQYKIISNTKK